MGPDRTKGEDPGGKSLERLEPKVHACPGPSLRGCCQCPTLPRKVFRVVFEGAECIISKGTKV